MTIEVVFAADVGGTHLRTAVVDRDGKIFYRQKRETPQSEQPDELVRAIAESFRECEAAATDQDQSISAISIAVPGTVNVAEGLVVTAPNLKALDNFRLGVSLSDQLARPVVLENDANAAAVGEWWRGAGRGFQTLICLTLGTGVGGGIILEGKLWRGIDGSAGEVGHIGIDPEAGIACGCGSYGCLEVYASATAILRMTHEARSQYPNSMLREHEELTAKEIYEAGRDGDELALEIFSRMGSKLGVGLASLINLLNPEVIVIAGGVSNAFDLFEKEMRREISERAFSVPARRAQIVKGECGDDAGLLGVARLAFDSNSSEVKL